MIESINESFPTTTTISEEEQTKCESISKILTQIGIAKRVAYFWLLINYILSDGDVTNLSEGISSITEYILKRANQDKTKFILVKEGIEIYESSDVSEEDIVNFFYPIEFLKNLQLQLPDGYKVKHFDLAFQNNLMNNLFFVEDLDKIIDEIGFEEGSYDITIYDDSKKNKFKKNQSLFKKNIDETWIGENESKYSLIDFALKQSELDKIVEKLEKEIKDKIGDGGGDGVGVMKVGESKISNNKPSLVLPSYTRVDFSVSYDVSDDLTLRLNAENLTDELYFPHSHSTHQASVGEPMNVRLSLTRRF